jgi:hypothetical protein
MRLSASFSTTGIVKLKALVLAFYSLENIQSQIINIHRNPCFAVFRFDRGEPQSQARKLKGRHCLLTPVTPRCLANWPDTFSNPASLSLLIWFVPLRSSLFERWCDCNLCKRSFIGPMVLVPWSLCTRLACSMCLILRGSPHDPLFVSK